ncbi:DUF721 domain-containing protein [Roseisalinus antarcticus]|uniref:RNA-binding protein n=1 Tax=Roseisalinus antarcticus TaxID=254357 RepID=A0A1Y5SPR5_9RHOB|nr:DciA family protein [Roseisalinus antarcticus]SLN42556.1 hypothetical protein ROA7023_01705 [Roseisalinus antarcticus]
MTQPRRPSTTRGFARASGLMQSRIRAATQSRGFAESRLLTHWAEIVGPEIAAICRPVEVTYGRQGMGATLCLLTTGAQAPMLEMQKGEITTRVNACYGYRAINRIRITQTAPIGFAEGQAAFGHAPKAQPSAPDPKVTETARDVARDVASDDLRLALEALGTNVLSRRKR